MCLENRLKTVNERCLLCHGPLSFAGMKPSICKSNLCKLSNEGLGLAFDLAQEIIDAPEVVDLLITMAYCATVDNGGSNMNFVIPIDVAVNVVSNQKIDGKKEIDPKKRTQKFLSFRKSDEECEKIRKKQKAEAESQKKAGKVARKMIESESETAFLDIGKLGAVMRKIPQVKKMIEWAKTPLETNEKKKSDKNQLERKLSEIDPLLPGLVRWCIQSQRAHFRKLRPEEEMKSVTKSGATGCVQFAFIQSRPEVEAKFLANKRQVEKMGRPGSVWSWHGSPVANWHPITRIGLKNLSNTKYMRVGAALGAGIYTAVSASTSAGTYCRPSSWPNSMFGTNIKLLALCEIVNWPLEMTTTRNGQYSGYQSAKLSKKKIGADGRSAMRFIPGNNWYIVEDECSICTRFLFLLKPGKNPNILGSAVNDIPNIMCGQGLKTEDT